MNGRDGGWATNQWMTALKHAMHVMMSAISSCRMPPNTAMRSTSALPSPCETTASPPTKAASKHTLNQSQGNRRRSRKHQLPNQTADTARSRQSATLKINKPTLSSHVSQVWATIPKSTARQQWKYRLSAVKSMVNFATLSNISPEIIATILLHRVDSA